MASSPTPPPPHLPVAAAATDAAGPAPSLIEYPCAFPIKVMGTQDPGFEAAMVDIVRRFDPAFDTTSVERRPSKGGNYLGLTLTVTATSREQLDELYRTLSTHPLVKVVL
jgi:putative lipoic acid-binding regulatory protein